MTTVVVSQPMLFPWAGMFEHLALADVHVHYDDVQFSKGSFTNRVQIKTAAGTSWLTVPLARRAMSDLIIDLAADDRQHWRARHARFLVETYRDAPHHREMLDLVDEVYADRSTPLVRVLERSMEVVARRFGSLASSPVHRSSELGIGGTGWQRVLDIVRAVGGDVYLTGHGASRYLDHDAFEAAGVEVRYMDYSCTPYPQLHGPFTPYVSILDLIANVGTSAAPGHLRPRTVAWRTFVADLAH